MKTLSEELLRLLDRHTLRDFARGKPCQIRIPEVCNGNSETTVLAHYRLGGLSGIGMKPPDWCAAWACSACHDEVDRRTHKLELVEVQLMHAEGVFRTQNEVIDILETLLA